MKTIKCSNVFVELLVGFLLLQKCASQIKRNSRPNIVFFLADDLGWNDVSYNGMNQIFTPNIDTLAGAGLILHNYYVQPSCTPSRASLLTGKYAIRTGTEHIPFAPGQDDGLSLNFTLLPQYLKRLNYSTHIVGKWHLGHPTKEYTPTYRGFDTHYGYWGGAVDYFQHTFSDIGKPKEYKNVPPNIGNSSIIFSGYDFRDNMNPVNHDTNKHMADLITKRSVKIIRSHDRKQPLFLYVAQIAVHAPNPNVPVITSSQYTARFSYIKDRLRRNFAGLLTQLDESVGSVFEALYSSDMLNNTIFIFSSDNGADTAVFPNGGSNFPLRGAKPSVFEGGVRVAGFVWSPLLQKVPRVSSDLMHISDWLPTLVSAAGGNFQDITGIDGKDQWKMIQNGEKGSRNDLLINIDPLLNVSAYREGEYKIVLGRNTQFNCDVFFGPSGIDPTNQGERVRYNNKVAKVFKSYYGIERSWKPALTRITCAKPPPKVPEDQCLHSPCLFNIVEDPCEYKDISSSEPEKTQELLQKMESYRDQVFPPYLQIVDYTSDPLKHCGLWTNWKDADQQNLDCCGPL